MSKSKPSYPASKTSPLPQAKPQSTGQMFTATSIRETIESVAIAFVLAFLFRAFEAEAFIIPTGSMAPTLMGRHKDLECPICKYPFQASASEEVERDGQPSVMKYQVGSVTCPMCRHTMEIGNLDPQPSYSGDRIIVNKFSYQFEDPKRWDVIVFYYPEGAKDNYIKRLVGLPGETLRIHYGDVFTRDDKIDSLGKPGDGKFNIARKPPEKLLAMIQPVFDNDYMPVIASYGWPLRWQSDLTENDSAITWTTEDNTVFKTDGASDKEVWLHYHHLVPNYAQWRGKQQNPPRTTEAIQPQLITDFTAYNTNITRGESDAIFGQKPDLYGIHWVGDLAVSTTVELENNTGAIVLELVKGGRKFQCRLDAATGQAVLSISGDDMKEFHPTAKTKFLGPGKFDLMFSNCDRELILWIDGQVVKFDAITAYGDLHNTRPTPADLQPVGVASLGAKAKVGRLKIFRDLYYIAAQKGREIYLEDYITVPSIFGLGDFAKFFSDATQWTAFDDSNMRSVEYPLKKDQFFALGDNSAKSRDSRLWNQQYWITRELLKGKAMFVYWPHSWDKIPYVNIPFPYFPNVSKMHFIK